MSDIHKKAREMFDEIDFSKFETEKDIVKYTMLHTEKIKDFIDQIIDLAIAERDKEIMEMVNNWSPIQWNEQSLAEMKTDIINLINSKKYL